MKRPFSDSQLIQQAVSDVVSRYDFNSEIVRCFQRWLPFARGTYEQVYAELDDNERQREWNLEQWRNLNPSRQENDLVQERICAFCGCSFRAWHDMEYLRLFDAGIDAYCTTCASPTWWTYQREGIWENNSSEYLRPLLASWVKAIFSVTGDIWAEKWPKRRYWPSGMDHTSDAALMILTKAVNPFTIGDLIHGRNNFEKIGITRASLLEDAGLKGAKRLPIRAHETKPSGPTLEPIPANSALVSFTSGLSSLVDTTFVLLRIKSEERLLNRADSRDHWCDEPNTSFGNSDRPISWFERARFSRTLWGGQSGDIPEDWYWSDGIQDRFEELLNLHGFKIAVLESLVNEYGGFWSFAAEQSFTGPKPTIPTKRAFVPWLEFLAPGIHSSLYSLPKNDPLWERREHRFDSWGIDRRVAGRGIYELLRRSFSCDHTVRFSTCLVCGLEFPMSETPPFSVAPRIDVCLSCQWMTFSQDNIGRPSKAFCETFVRDYYSLWGQHIRSDRPVQLAADVSDLEFFRKSFVLRAVSPKWDHITEIYGDRMHLLAAAGFELVREGQGGIQSVARDGHHCLSEGELAVCNYFFDNSISHEHEPLYPHHPLLNGSANSRRADWSVDGVLIEYAGRLDDSSYRAVIEEKIALAAELNIELVIIRPSDLARLDQLLRRFKKVGTSS